MSTPEVRALQAQISALQQRVDRLQASQNQPGEALTPYYLTIGPTGLVTANFSGVFTGNLQIPESVAAFSNPPFQPGGAVEWDNAGMHREFIQGTRLNANEPTAHILTVGTDTISIVNRAYLRMGATDAASAIAGGSYISMTVEDSVAGGVDGALLYTSQGVSIFKQTAVAIQRNGTGNLTNAPYAPPPISVCNVQLPSTLSLPCMILVNARCTIDVITNSNAYMTITVNGNGIYDIRGPVAGGLFSGATGAGTPILSYLMSTVSPAFNTGGITQLLASGSGDWSPLPGPGPGGSPMVMGGDWVPVWIPNNALFNAPNIILEYGVGPAGTYDVVNQSLAVMY